MVVSRAAQSLELLEQRGAAGDFAEFLGEFGAAGEGVQSGVTPSRSSAASRRVEPQPFTVESSRATASSRRIRSAALAGGASFRGVWPSRGSGGDLLADFLGLAGDQPVEQSGVKAISSPTVATWAPASADTARGVSPAAAKDVVAVASAAASSLACGVGAGRWR